VPDPARQVATPRESTLKWSLLATSTLPYRPSRWNSRTEAIITPSRHSKRSPPMPISASPVLGALVMVIVPGPLWSTVQTDPAVRPLMLAATTLLRAAI